MIGQKQLSVILKSLIEKGDFPRFLIIQGNKGSGKKTMAHEISKWLNAYEVIPGASVEAVRDTIVCSYKCDHPTVYVFPEADKMSIAAKNALLKITEEPPKEAYFILTTENANGVLPTLLSRATMFSMESYTTKDLCEFIKTSASSASDSDQKILLDIAENPGQVLELLKMNLEEFVAFAHKVLDNIGIVTGVNALKITNSFSFKDDTPGYNPILFLNCIIRLCYTRTLTENSNTISKRLFDTIYICGVCKRELYMTGVKKDSTFDMWLLNMRRIWREE